jgi:hypothetical protein
MIDTPKNMNMTKLNEAEYIVAYKSKLLFQKK